MALGSRVHDDGTFTTSTLHRRYDPAHDYGPWIQLTRRQVAARRIKEINFELAVADALGGQFIATSPFHGRLLTRMGAATTPAPALIWADVPALPDADPETLARIAAEDETVQALRRTVRRGMSVASAGGQLSAASEIAQQLREDAAVLGRTIARDRIWTVVVPTVTGIGRLRGAARMRAAPTGFCAGARVQLLQTEASRVRAPPCRPPGGPSGVEGGRPVWPTGAWPWPKLARIPF